MPFPAGGVTDVVARLTAERLTADLGQQVIVDNKAGAGGVIGTEVVAKAPPDGYTILFTTPNHTINAALRASMPFDTEKDLVPISVVGRVPMLLVSHPSLPFKDFAGFVDYARKNPGKLNVAHAGNGTLPHITMELLQVKEHMKVTNVPYRGAAPALADLVAGHGAGQARQLHDLGAVRRRQAAERARRHQRQAPEADPRRADHDGERAGLRGLSLDGPGGAGRHAASGDRQARRRRQARGRACPTCRPASTRTRSSRSAARQPSSRR